MSEVIFLKCDECGKIVKSDNHYEERWIRLEGSLSKGTGKYRKGAYSCQYIGGIGKNPHHFCSWECLEKHDDNKRVRRQKKKK